MKLIYNELPQFSDGNGEPYSGALLYFYVAGSSTKLNTYQDADGNTAHQNPIVLDSAGRVPAAIFGTGSYKIILAPSTDTDPPQSPIWTIDNVQPINETTTTQDQWGDAVTATYVSASQFTVLGDQTSTFQPGRRIKVSDAGGTKIGVITAATFSTNTTVTVSLDSGTLSSPVSSANLSLLTATDHAVPVGPVVTPTILTADTNNWSPSGIATAKVLRISADARRAITGLLAGSDGRVLDIDNVGTFPIPLKYQDGGSSAANRFAFAATLGGGQTMKIRYDATSLRWRAVNVPEPIGTVKDFGTSTMPEGFLAIDQNVSRTTYASLFNEVGTAWGVGDGSTTFGLFIGKGAALIAAGTGTQDASGVDADVDLSANTLTVVSNDKKWVTGMAVLFTLASGTITGLTTATTYYVIRNSATLVKLATSLALAQAGTAIDLTAKSSPVWSIVHTYAARTHGERLGEEGHAMSSTELLAHLHPGSTGASSGTWPYRTAGSAGTTFFTPNTDQATNATQAVTISPTVTVASEGGNALMNNMQPSSVVTRGIRHC